MTDEPPKPTVVQMKPKPTAMERSVEELRRALPMMMEAAESVAKMRRIAYLAYLREGFTEIQSLELCCR